MSTKTKKSRTKLKEELQKIINELASQPCLWHYCPGPNARPIPMLTCRKCWVVKDLRNLRDDL